MLIHDTLDKLAETAIPSGIHPQLHVESRTAWVETVVELYEKKHLKFNYATLSVLVNSWEQLLYQKYSALN
jgi:hypothetical protein